MNALFELTIASRKLMLPYLENYTLEQLNKIPDGFTNNLFWNIAHSVVVQQLLTYKLSGLPMQVSDDMIALYKKGTKPEQTATQEEVDNVKEMLFTTIAQTKTDYENNIFQNFIEYPTSAGFTLRSVEDAMKFNAFHEGLHLGVMMSIKKML